MSLTDCHYMQMALALGARGLGQVAPNPAVGCVIVKDGVIVGRGTTQKGGRPHAETEALHQAGDSAKGATAYVTLEPCSHHGKTPPCAEALIKAGIVRVVVAQEDPDPRVCGKGVAMLKAAGLDVVEGVLEDEAEYVQEGFLKRIRHGRPLFTLKLATTLDGRIALASGESRWITGETARAAVHRLRASHDAVMIGIGTALADNPELTCRLPGLEQKSIVRVVVDRQLSIKPDSRLVETAAQLPTWILTRDGRDTGRAAQLEKKGVKIISVPADDVGYIDLRVAARKLGDEGLTRVLVEGGAYLAAAMLKDDVIDRLEWFTAPRVIGGDGHEALKALAVQQLAQTPRFRPVSCRLLGEDRLETFVRAG